MNFQLIHGDCLEVMPKLPHDSVQMVFADLPYMTTGFQWDKEIPLEQLWPQLTCLATPAARLVFTAIQPFSSMLVTALCKHFRYDLIWAKGKGTGHLSANKRPLRAHEHVLVFGEGAGVYNPQKTVGPRVIRSGLSGMPSVGHYAAHKQSQCVKTNMRFPTSVLPIVSNGLDNLKKDHCIERRFHPTQKPVALLEWLVKTYTSPGDTVLDPVMGSGTTGVACLRTGRSFVGIEKDAKYFAVASKRIAAEQQQMRLAV